MDPQIAESLATAYAKIAQQQLEGGDSAGAYASAQAAIELMPASAALQVLIGDVLLTCGDRSAALELFERGLSAAPEDPQLLTRLAYLCERDDLRRAIELHRRAVDVAPAWAAAHHNLAGALFMLGDNAGGMAASRATLALAPQYDDAHLALGESLLRAGRLREGWPEWRWRPKPAPYWDGTPFAGQRLLVGRDQGLGDAIWSMRYLPQVKARGGNVLYECAPELFEVARSVEGVDTFYGSGQPVSHDAYDLCVPALDLPLIFETSMETIPAATPYLKAPARSVQRWRERLALDPSMFNAGIVWSGNRGQALNAVRSCRLDDFGAIASLAKMRLYSLQRDGGDVVQQSAFPIVDLGSEIQSLGDTAAILELLDLLITIDSAPAHLAGALGRPIWVLLSTRSHWMYHLERDDSPWYPSMRVFRQEAAYEWGPVFERLCSELGYLGTLKPS